MNSRFQRRSGIGWSALLIVLAIALFGGHFRLFEAVDGKIYDSFHRFAQQRADDSSVLLVECNPATLQRGNPDLDTLLNRISKSSPLAIGVVSDRTSVPISMAVDRRNGCPVVEGRPSALIEESILPRLAFRSCPLNPSLSFGSPS